MKKRAAVILLIIMLLLTSCAGKANPPTADTAANIILPKSDAVLSDDTEKMHKMLGSDEAEPAFSPSPETDKTPAPVVGTAKIGMTWRANNPDGTPSVNKKVMAAIEGAGAEAVQINQVKFEGFEYDENGVLLQKYVDNQGALRREYADMLKASPFNSNAAEAVGGLKMIIFTGGADFSPSLFTVPKEIDNDKCTFDATRDVSDYLTMRYCLEHNLGIVGICRGMQVLGIVSGMTYIQDIGTYLGRNGVSYNGMHGIKVDGKSKYVQHGVEIIKNSIAYDIFGTTKLDGVMSSHHQSTGEPSDCITVTGTTDTCGFVLPEIIERTDKTFAIGVQFHPEAAVDRRDDMDVSSDTVKQAERFFEYVRDTALLLGAGR